MKDAFLRFIWQYFSSIIKIAKQSIKPEKS